MIPLRRDPFLLFVPLLLGALAASRVDSFDIFWQLQTGRYMAGAGQVIRSDLFSLAAEAPRIEHCWLHDLICYGLYSLGGFEALSLLKGALMGGTAFFLLAAARLLGASTLSLGLLTLPALGRTAWAWIDRPQLWSFFFFALFLYLLVRHGVRRDRLVLLLGPLFILWGNLHAGALMGLALAGAFAAAELFGLLRSRRQGEGRADRLLWLALAGVVAASFVHPYGSFLWRMLALVPGLGADSGAVEQAWNMDWKITALGDSWDFFLALGGGALLMILGRKATCGAHWLLMAGLALAGWRLERHTPFFLFAFAALVPACFDACLRRLEPRRLGRPLAAAALVLSLLSLRDVWLRNGLLDTGLEPMKYPLNAADFLERERPPGNLFNAYEWGGYLMWRLYPDYLVFWDGRQDSADYFRRGLRILYGEPDWQRELDRAGVNTLVLKPLSVDLGGRFLLLDRLRQSPDWALVEAGANDLVFVRRAAVGPAWLTGRELPMDRIDDVILSEAAFLLSEHGKNRYRSWWEMFRIHYYRRQYPLALEALEAFRAHAPGDEAQSRIVTDYLEQLRAKAGVP